MSRAGWQAVERNDSIALVSCWHTTLFEPSFIRITPYQHSVQKTAALMDESHYTPYHCQNTLYEIVYTIVCQQTAATLLTIGVIGWLVWRFGGRPHHHWFTIAYY